MTDRHVIDTASEYASSLRSIAAGSGPVAIDTERASGYRYSQKAYLIQVFRRGSGVFLFDAPAIGRFDDLNEAIGDDEWVLHAASQDLPSLRDVGIDPHTLFDTELAARLLGMSKVGLGAVVEDTLGVHLAKEHSAADWSTRPLPQPWLEYAALDVELLVDVRDELEQRLVDQRKTRIAREEFDAELHAEPKPPRPDPWRKLSGIHSVRGSRHLAVARELWHARDELARETDTAPGRLVPDRSLVTVVKSMPKTKEALAGLREFTGRASRTELDRWWSAVERGLTTDDIPEVRRGNGDHVPPPRAWADRDPEADARLKRAKPAIAKIADALGMPVENVLKPSLLREVAWHPPASVNAEAIAARLRASGARAWQCEATAQSIAQAFVDAAQIGAPEPESAS
ncbi:HRDC domain-containing protein [Paramicrobacterium agarici]|uniref:Ribonuclease D n=1 Tax=Paramicrobacterium agarici TaxID=630514 RepID=A0A2A9DX62_9MICO|nr:HRDC domain-containing protein [Microbacterium agarici]PFG31278.1 ribonuclease D [Microbacterium agarici]TQO24380.1 ribonuclease D [Microbacterium agarici]